MGKSTPQAPTPVDPTTVANAQTASNQATAQFQSQLNNANSYTPYGSVVQTQDPNSQQWTSTTTLSPQEQSILDSSQQAQQSALGVANQQIARVGDALGQGLTPGQMQTGVSGGPLQTSFDPGQGVQTSFNQGQGVQGQINTPQTQQAINQAEQASYGSAMNLLQPQMQQAAEHQNAQLVAQGLNPNDAAYQNSQTLFNNSQNEQLNQAANSAVAAGQQEQNTLFGQAATLGNFANSAAAQEFNQNQAQGTFANSAAAQQYNQNQGQAAFANTAQGQQFAQGQQNASLYNQAEGAMFNQQAAAQSQPINEFSALLGAGQVTSPTGTGFSPTTVAPTDTTGAYALNVQQQQAQYQAQLAQQQAGLTGLFGLGSAALTAFSDVRLKRDIERVGTHRLGLPIYSFRYVWDAAARHVGVLAQDVQKIIPAAVVERPDGLLMVNYLRLA